MRLIFILATAVVVIAIFGEKHHHASQYHIDDSDTSFVNTSDALHRAKMAISNLPVTQTSNKYQAGVVSFVGEDRKITEKNVNRFVKQQRAKGKQVPSNLVWRNSKYQDAAASAIGVDFKHHFVNSYLVGVHPFKVENNWLPLYVIAKLKTYQYDQEQYKQIEVWQNSAQALMLPRGDCEDHALALADWLISEGVDAKVVLGKYKTGGHAWVVANVDGKSYLLEATDKRLRKNWNNYPLAALSQHYYPTHMFNREEFWVNTRKDITRDYVGSHWVKTSHFKNIL